MMADEFALTPTEPAPREPQTGRIDIVATCALTSLELGWFELWGIESNFTREGVARWLDGNGTGPVGDFVSMYGWVDFHVVLGDREIPWATEEARARFE
jgi:hypothetical protein